MAIIATNGFVNNGLYPAYRPVLLNAIDNGATGIPPEVYCDVYFDGTYYKTISSNVASATVGVLTSWIFDISGLAQEYIKTKVYDITQTTLATVYDGSANLNGETYTYCKIRISTADAYGVITPGGPLPVQATYNSPAVAGGGYVSDQSWYIVNASLQVQDSMSLESMLQVFRISGVFDSSGETVNAAYKVYQLSYATKMYSYINDYGQMALLTGYNAFLGSSTSNVGIKVMAYNAAGTLIYASGISYGTLNSGRIYTLPTGLKNITAMFPALVALLPTVSYYRVGLYDITQVPMMYVTPPIYYLNRDGVVNNMNYMIPGMNTTAPKHTRIWFKNYLGQFDAVNFIERVEKLKVSSTSFEVALTANPDGFMRSQLSRGRYNVHSSETNAATGYFNESHLPLLKQLFATSQAYLEFTSPEGIADPPVALLLPIIIVDGDYDSQTWEDRYEYPVTVQYIPSNENIIVR